MTTVTLESVLAQARQLAPTDQVRLIQALIPVEQTNTVADVPVSVDDEELDDVAEQQETWAYLQRVLDEDRLSARPLFSQETEQE